MKLDCFSGENYRSYNYNENAFFDRIIGLRILLYLNPQGISTIRRIASPYIVVAVAAVALGVLFASTNIMGNLLHHFIASSSPVESAESSLIGHGPRLIVAEATTVPFRALSYALATDTDGDASSGSNIVKVDMLYLDSDAHCENCVRIDYNPYIVGKAGIAWEPPQPLDVQGAKRLVFGAKGQFGGEQVKFMVLGKQTGIASSITDEKLFENIEFVATTETITLESDWERYQIAIPDADAEKFTDITHLMAVELDGGNGVRPVTIFLKGFYFDEQVLEEPLVID